MSDNTPQYRTVMGIVQFDPKPGEAAGKQIRSVVIRQVGFKEQSQKVYITLWPSHDDIEIERGDVLLVEGKYSRGSGTSQSGESVTYHNISASRVAKLGAASDGKRPEVANAGDEGDDAGGDDIPF